MTLCPACGKDSNTNDKFCGGCGMQLSEGSQQYSEIIDADAKNNVVVTCDSCGAGMTEGQIFCTECGSGFGGIEDAE